MTIYDQLLQQVLALQSRDCSNTIHLQNQQISELRSYYIDGGEPLESHQKGALLDQIHRGGFNQLYRIEWSLTNSAAMIESGLHLFVSKQQAQQWRDQHPNALYHSLTIDRLSGQQAEQELERLHQS